MAREVFRYIDDGEHFRNLMARLEGSPELVRLTSAVTDERGKVIEPVRYTTREMLAVESRMVEHAPEMAVKTHRVGRALAAALARYSCLSAEQQRGGQVITSESVDRGGGGFCRRRQVGGHAAARDAWEAEGYRVWAERCRGSRRRTWSGPG